MVAIPFLLLDAQIGWGIDTGVWGRFLIWIAAILTVWSMVYYLRKDMPFIKENAK
jgi:CDP-diacylglycerol--glycerol-3-phosphate 3-phosphatidyltransferase